MGLLTGPEIIAKKDRKIEELYIPEWDGTVHISEMGADARDEFEQFLHRERDRLLDKPKIQPKGQHKKKIKPQNRRIFSYSSRFCCCNIGRRKRGFAFLSCGCNQARQEKWYSP